MDDCLGGADDVIVAAVVDGEIGDIFGVMFGLFFRFGDLFNQERREAVFAAEMDELNFIFIGFFEVVVDELDVELHQVIDFFFGAVPVFGRKAPEGDGVNSPVAGGAGKDDGAVKAFFMALEGVLATGACPAAVSVGDDGDVVWDGSASGKGEMFRLGHGKNYITRHRRLPPKTGYSQLPV